MHLIRREVLELPTNRGGVNLVNIPTKIDALRIKHIIDLIFGDYNPEWKVLGRYWLGIRLKAMEDIKALIDWKGSFAETPNELYQKCFELFKQFLENIKQQDLEVDLAHLKTKGIYELLIENKKMRPVVETKYPLINFKKIYKDFSQIQIQASDLDLAYKVMHRSINVKAKLKRLQIVTDDTCPLCYNASETIEHLFLHCQIVQKAKKNILKTWLVIQSE